MGRSEVVTKKVTLEPRPAVVVGTGYSLTLLGGRVTCLLKDGLVFALGTCVARGQVSMEKRAKAGLVVSLLSWLPFPI